MDLLSNILGTLVTTQMTRGYCLRHPLKYAATKFTEASPRPALARSTPVCLFVGVAVGCSSEPWIPTIKHLYRLHTSPQSPVRTLSVWVIDRPNHGDAAVLNRDTLQKHYRSSFPSIKYGAAMNELRESGLLSGTELDNLVAIGHSGAGAAFMHAGPSGLMLPYKLFILIDGPFMDRTDTTEKFLRVLEARFGAATRKMASEWPTVKEAMTYLRRVSPWDRFDDENLEIMAVAHVLSTVIRRLETDGESALSGGGRIVEMLRAPNASLIHYILATDQDLWPPPMAAAIRSKVAGFHDRGLGLTEVDAGHHAPHEKPDLTATSIMQVLTDRLGKLNARI